LSTDVAHCWRRLCNLVDWALRAETDSRAKAREVVRSLLAYDNESHQNELRRAVFDELAAQSGAHVPLGDLRRQSAWLAILHAANAEFRATAS
jgi:hypothetical protein